MVASKAVRKKYDFLAKIYDRIYANYISKTVGSALQAIPLRGNEKILDIGCGTGALEIALVQKNPDLHITGVDISADMLALAQKKMAGFPNVVFKEGDFLSVDLPENSFDAAFSLSNLHYFQNPFAVLKKTHRLLKKDGWLVLIDWNRNTLKGKIYNTYMRAGDPSFIKIYTPAEGSELFKKCGFTLQKTDLFGVGLLWKMMRLVAGKT